MNHEKHLTTIELHRDDLSFSAGHFTIFSATDRETLHGHNYTIYLALTTEVSETGLMFDYRHYKYKIRNLTQELNRKFILPLNSPYLKIENQGDMVFAYFDQEKIPFLTKDVVMLPITNATVEELSYWFLKKLMEDQSELDQHAVHAIHIKIFSSPGQSGSAYWKRS